MTAKMPILLEAFIQPRGSASGLNESIKEAQAEACSLPTKLPGCRPRNTPSAPPRGCGEQPTLFLINGLGVGGAENVFIRDINLLSEKGFEINLALLFGNEQSHVLLKKLSLPKEKIFYCRAKSLLDYQSFWRLKKFIVSHKIGVIFSTLNEANIWCRLLKFFRPRLRVIIREANVATNKPLKFKILDFLFYPITANILAVSEGVKETLKYLPQSKIGILENGVPISPKEAVFRESISFPKLLFVGSLTAKKSLPFLIGGLKVLSDMGHKFELNIVGDGPERPKIELLINEFKLSGLVHLQGQIEDDKIRNVFYENSDIFIMPSLYEGSPNSLLKAISYKLPVISSDFLGVESIIKDGQSGIIVSQGNVEEMAAAILFYMNNPNKRKEMAENAFKILKERYSLEAHMNNLIKILYR